MPIPIRRAATEGDISSPVEQANGARSHPSAFSIDLTLRVNKTLEAEGEDTEP